jgi:hypothetical protein
MFDGDKSTPLDNSQVSSVLRYLTLPEWAKTYRTYLITPLIMSGLLFTEPRRRGCQARTLNRHKMALAPYRLLTKHTGDHLTKEETRTSRGRPNYQYPLKTRDHITKEQRRTSTVVGVDLNTY